MGGNRKREVRAQTPPRSPWLLLTTGGLGVPGHSLVVSLDSAVLQMFHCALRGYRSRTPPAPGRRSARAQARSSAHHAHSIPEDEEPDDMRKVEMAARIAAHTDPTKSTAEAAVEAILATIKQGLQQCLLQHQVEAFLEASATCPDCGTPLKAKG